MIVILTIVIFQQQLVVATPKEGTDNQTANFQTVIPESPVNGNITKHHSEIATGPQEPPNDDVVNCATLGCPNNPPNLHGPPTEEPEGDG